MPALPAERTRHFCPSEVPKSCARRAPEIDRAILSGFVPGLSTCKVGPVLSVAAFHRRPLQNVCKAPMLDGVVLARKTGAGALRRPVPVALGIRHDGSESAAEREAFLDRLYDRGITGEGSCVDGGKGLLAALPVVWHAEVPGAQDPQG